MQKTSNIGIYYPLPSFKNALERLWSGQVEEILECLRKIPLSCDTKGDL